MTGIVMSCALFVCESTATLTCGCGRLCLLQVAGYKVKCMLAEPKTKRKPEGAFQDVFGGHMQQGKLDYGMGGPGPAGPIGGSAFSLGTLESVNTGWRSRACA